MVIENNNIIGGNLTDQALIKFLKFNKAYNKTITEKKVFDSKDKYSYIKVDNCYYYKGAFESIINKCINVNKTSIINDINKLSNQGYRILAVAKSQDNINLEYLGYITLKDNIRKETTSCIDELINSNIKVIMITGDALSTAKVIAKECHILNNFGDICIDSKSFNNMSDDEIKSQIDHIKVIARALPSDKSRLVTILKDMNKVVGMTGDGVNDAPALKKANVGFSMGSGSEVAKEASDIVILDNNISSICKAILYGRTAFKSIRKFVVYQLTVNFTALFLSFIGSPITIIQMLWLNMIMDTFAGLAFSFEAPLKYYMKDKVKDINENIINTYMYTQIIFTGLYSAIICTLFLKLDIFKTLIRSDNKYFMTAYFALFIFIGICNSFNARCERLNIFSNILKNKMFIFINIFIITMQIIIIYYGNNLFKTYGLLPKELLFVILLSLTVIPIDLIRKIILIKKGIRLEI